MTILDKIIAFKKKEIAKMALISKKVKPAPKKLKNKLKKKVAVEESVKHAIAENIEINVTVEAKMMPKKRKISNKKPPKYRNTI